MITNAALAPKHAAHLPNPQALDNACGRHARANARPVIRVIAGGAAAKAYPLHARAVPTPQPSAQRVDASVAAAAGLAGVGYNLSRRDLTVAAAAGILFFAAALAAALM